MPPTEVVATGTSASSATAIPYDSSTSASSGPRRAGSRTAIAIAAGSAPASISSAACAPIASASDRSPAERSSTSASPGGRRAGSGRPSSRCRWTSSGSMPNGAGSAGPDMASDSSASSLRVVISEARAASAGLSCS